MKILQFLLLLTAVFLFFVDSSVIYRTKGKDWKPKDGFGAKKSEKESHQKKSHHLMGGKIGMAILKPVTGPGASRKEKES
ncbi:hypothetical protein CAEBREN_17460 [Caenorhabditis brenneri]|uniref:Uncharacterized protein n=1 Tax=Caenorhabditis brenneri TaxID=135651 RepID=G0NJH7_CAEBE|nr:hypothetical protein CAEBREN_17460 [Caenorhabditis brenneri]